MFAPTCAGRDSTRPPVPRSPRHPRKLLSKETILDRLWGYAFDDNLVEVYVGYLRRKLGEPVLIQTLRGAGYALREPA